MVDIKQAQKEVRQMYEYLLPMIEETAKKHCQSVDALVNKIRTNQANLSNTELESYLRQLGIELYFLDKVKNDTTLMKDCATIAYKEAQANSYNLAVGTQTAKANQAIIDNIDKQMVELIYKQIEVRLKSSYESAFRLLNILNSLLISANARQKIMKGASVDYNESDLYGNGFSDDNPA